MKKILSNIFSLFRNRSRADSSCTAQPPWKKADMKGVSPDDVAKLADTQTPPKHIALYQYNLLRAAVLGGSRERTQIDDPGESCGYINDLLDFIIPGEKHKTSIDAIIDDIDYALERGADINAREPMGDLWSALHYAVYYQDDLSVAAHLLKRGADINAVETHGRTPLAEVLEGMKWKTIPFDQGDKAVRFLLDQKNGSQNQIDVNLAAPLYKALDTYSSMEIPVLLLERGAAPNFPCHPGSANTIFSESVSRMPCDKIKLLIDHGAQINWRSPDTGITPILLAAYLNPDIDVIKTLIEHGANYQIATFNGTTFFIQASGNPNADIIKYVVEELGQNDVNVVNKDGFSAIHGVAMSNPNPAILEYLLEKGAAVNTIWREQTPLDYAIGFEKGTRDHKHEASLKIQMLRNAGGKTYLEIISSAENTEDDKSSSKLLDREKSAKINDTQIPISRVNIWGAAAAGSVDDVRFFVSQGEDVNEKEEDLGSPLHMAAVMNADMEVAEFLISQGADVNAKRKDGATPLHLAGYAGGKLYHDKTFAVGDEAIALLKQIAQTDFTAGVAKILVAHDADVNAKDNIGTTPLHYAAGKSPHVEALKFLVSKGANVNATNHAGETPLHRAAGDNKNAEIIEFLISQGADVNATDNGGLTPLLNAVTWNDNVEVIKLLVSKGAKTDVKFNNGLTLLHMAAANKNANVIKFLVSLGLDINIRDKMGRAPLHFAAKDNTEVVKFLVSLEGIDLNAGDINGETPLSIADRMNISEEVSRILIAHGGH